MLRTNVAMESVHRYFEITCVSLLLLMLITGCTTNYRELDETEARRQFHVPAEVPLDTLVSHPETGGGWFGREGLRIRAVFRFTERQYQEYLRTLDSRDIWTPVTFQNYSPDRAETYSAASMRWSALPLPNFPLSLSSITTLFDTTLTRGFYFCCVIRYARGDSIPHSGGGYHFEWQAQAVHGTAFPDDQSPVITIFGILDHDTRRLFAWLGFSG